MSKFNSKTVVADGISFPSATEYQYYEALKIRQSKGEIKCFELQPQYELIPPFKYQDKKVQGISYKPDFLIYHNDDTEECIEIKGMLTEPSQIRIKLFKYNYPNLKITVLSRNIKYGDQYNFIDYYELQKIRTKNRKVKKEKDKLADKQQPKELKIKQNERGQATTNHKIVKGGLVIT